jgi:hypothetical protein
MGILTKMLDFLPTYFNTDSQRRAAFELTYYDPTALMQHSIVDGVLSARSFHSVSNDFEINFVGKTIQQVADEINAFPHYQATVLAGFERENAIRLVDVENESGSKVYIHDSPTWALFKAISLELKEAKLASAEILRQMSIPGAEGIFSDLWGQYFGLGRRPGELDIPFDQRIIDSVKLIRSNNVGMEIILQNAYGYYIQVFDLDFIPGTLMLMNNTATPMHNKSFPIHDVQAIGKEPCVFGLRFPEGTISQWNKAQFDELRELVYSIRAAGTRPKLFWRDDPVFTPAEIPYISDLYFYTKYL